MSSVQIYLDNYENCCYPGQTIAGRVECVFNKEKNLRAIRVKFKGKAETQWTESESHYNSVTKKHESRSVRYYAEEIYFDAAYNLVQGGEEFHLPPGKHVYPFSYILPAHLPSSFEGSYGCVRYYVKATVDRPWKFDYDHTFTLNVESPLDLNFLPNVRDPVATSVDKTMCSCWCNDSGALTFEMSLPATGFVPGQDIHIGAHVANLTNVSADHVKFKIVADLEFISYSPRTKHRYDERTITACREGGIGAHGDKSWSSTLTIPNDHSYPNLIPCSIINVRYRLEAKVVVPCPHTNLDNEVPITIGTIPLTGVVTTFSAGPPPSFPVSPLSESAPLMQNSTFYPGDGAPSYPGGAAAPYPPSLNTDDFEVITNPSMPVPGGTPYPPPGGPPYPSGGAPYPPGGGGAPSMPVPGGAPYPSSGSIGFGEKAPSAPAPGEAPYPPYASDAKVPYPPANGTNPSAPSCSAPYPPAPGGSPYPPAASAPLPPGSAPYPPNGAPYPPGNKDFALPSYDEAKEQRDKNEKSGF